MKLGPKAKDAVPALAAACRDKDPEVRIAVAYALAEIGPAAREAGPELQMLALEKSGPVRGAAAYALQQVFRD